jgi:hypothetical protein
VSGLPERLQETVRVAKAAGLGDLHVDQLDGLTCVHCGRSSRAMVPLEGFYGGLQLFACEPGDPRGCQPAEPTS